MSDTYGINYLNDGFRKLVGKDFENWQKGRQISPEDLAEAIRVAMGPPETMYYLCDHANIKDRYEGHFQEDYIGQWCDGLVEVQGWGIV